MKRIVYVLTLILILELICGFPASLVAGIGSNQNAIVTITVSAKTITPPPPPPPGGGGGGAPAPPPPPPGVRDVSSLITVNGVFTHRVTILSADRLAQLTLNKGTRGLTGDRFPISEISIIPMEEPPCDPPEGAIIIGQVYDIGPDGATFDPPIFITFTYDQRHLPKGVAEEDLTPVRWDDDVGEWVPLEFWIVDPETNTITGLIRHFTPFTILAQIRTAAFATSDILVTPTEVNTGETVNIITVVSNTSGQSGSYEVTLKINGVDEASRTVTITAGDSALVSFSTTKDTAGTYLVEVNGLTGSFTVEERPEAPPAVTPPTTTPPAVTPPTTAPPVTPTPFNWPVIGGIIAAVAAMAGLIYFLLVHRRYRYAPSTFPVEVERPVVTPPPMPPPPKSISYPAAISIGEIIGKIIAAVAAAIAGGAGFLIGIRQVITRLMAAIATAIAGGVSFLIGKREVITRLLASAATATASGASFLIGKREVITRLLASVATAIIGWVRLLLSKWKPKKPH